MFLADGGHKNHQFQQVGAHQRSERGGRTGPDQGSCHKNSFNDGTFDSVVAVTHACFRRERHRLDQSLER